jgi:hypothetical protein
MVLNRWVGDVKAVMLAETPPIHAISFFPQQGEVADHSLILSTART